MGKNPWRKILGGNIKRFRTKKGWTLEEAAENYGCILRRWQAFEAGENLQIDTIARIAKLLDIQPWQLLK